MRLIIAEPWERLPKRKNEREQKCRVCDGPYNKAGICEPCFVALSPRPRKYFRGGRGELTMVACIDSTRARSNGF